MRLLGVRRRRRTKRTNRAGDPNWSILYVRQGQPADRLNVRRPGRPDLHCSAGRDQPSTQRCSTVFGRHLTRQWRASMLPPCSPPSLKPTSRSLNRRPSRRPIGCTSRCTGRCSSRCIGPSTSRRHHPPSPTLTNLRQPSPTPTNPHQPPPTPTNHHTASLPSFSAPAVASFVFLARHLCRPPRRCAHCDRPSNSHLGRPGQRRRPASRAGARARDQP